MNEKEIFYYIESNEGKDNVPKFIIDSDGINDRLIKPEYIEEIMKNHYQKGEVFDEFIEEGEHYYGQWKKSSDINKVKEFDLYDNKLDLDSNEDPPSFNNFKLKKEEFDDDFNMELGQYANDKDLINYEDFGTAKLLSLIHISEPTSPL